MRDRRAHVRIAQLRQYGAIHVVHHGMDDALRMDDHLDLMRACIEQPAGLDQFEPLFIMLAESTEIFRPMDQLG